MKFGIALPSFVLPFLAISNALSFRGGDQTILNDDFSVPGINPLQFCHDPSHYILTIDRVDLTPNPPVPCVLCNILFSRVLQLITSQRTHALDRSYREFHPESHPRGHGLDNSQIWPDHVNPLAIRFV
jgi:hypothetical protein